MENVHDATGSLLSSSRPRKKNWWVLLPIVIACILSLVLQTIATSLCPVPQTDLFIATLIQRKLDRAAAIGNTPKLVILAGSSGLFSHRCQTMEPIVGRPCVNASVAVGVGLDYMFARWKPMLHPGDVVYMPMEPPQYVRSRAENRVGPETRLMIHQQWGVLAKLPLDREMAAMLSVDLPTELRNLITEPPLTLRMQHIDVVLNRDFNAWGDRIGHTEKDAAGAQGKLDDLKFQEPSAKEIANGYGTELISRFVRWATAHGVTVIGGLSTEFADVPLPSNTIETIRAIYERNGGLFLLLPNHSRYPRHDFFDTRFHLYEAKQIEHSQLVAEALRNRLLLLKR